MKFSERMKEIWGEYNRKDFINKYGKKIWDRRFSMAIKSIVIKNYGGKCKCCGELTIEFLTIDHTSKIVRKFHRKVSGKGHRFYKWLINNGFPRKGIRVLCMNCNIATAWGRICPHKQK